MLESIRKAVAIPSASVEGLATVASTAAFLWLLANGFIEPIAVFLLELFLTF